MSILGISHYEDGFRLGGPPSECSLRSKAQIDALFEDSRSICSSTLGGWYAGLSVVIPSNPNDANEEQKRVNSAVQARIEAMFASVEAESGTPGECAAAILPDLRLEIDGKLHEKEHVEWYIFHLRNS
ncbi:hypothetical protein G5I_05416 [Acromyrmex echinatior]|uniref:Uncharacterized protein n=1 Tax=Acromyrmex echinatior TaxID=103372 RepID=F4WI94_ACREC|nr:hypothetical protein G5I_05416 [Acromyrmex echinatior]